MRKILSKFIFIFILSLLVVPAFASSEKAQVKALYKEGVLLYKAGRLDEAKEKFESILSINPTYAPARSKIRVIQNKQERFLRRDKIIAGKEKLLEAQNKWFSKPKKPEIKEEVPAVERFRTERQKIIEEKAQQIISEINFTDAHLRDVLQYLSRISGINIILDEDLFVRQKAGGLGIPLEVEVVSEEEPAESEEVEESEWEAETTERVPLSAPTYTTIISDRVTISLRNIPLMEALKYILTAKGLKYRIDEYAIVVSTRQRLEQVEMETRYYHLTAGIGSFTKYIEPVSETEEMFEFESEEIEEKKPERLTIKDVLEQSGVPFPSGSKIFLDQRTGTLIIRNTPANLTIIEDILRILDVTPYQVEIETRFVQINRETAEELGLEWMIKSGNYTFGFGNGKNMRLDNTTLDSQYGKYQPTTDVTGKEGVTRGLRYLTPTTGSGDTASDTSSGSILSISGILTKPQFRMILHALNQDGNANLISAPKVTTLNNQRAQIEMVEEFIYPDEYELTPPTVRGTTWSSWSQNQNTGRWNYEEIVTSTEIITPGIAVPISFETRDIGIILNVVPSVGADRKTITLTLIPEISEFIDWMDYGIEEGVGWNKIPIKKPVFQTRNVTTSVVINDGETVVLGGLIKEDLRTSEDKIPLLGDIPLLGVLFRNTTKVSVKTNLIIFVTAKLLTPSGGLVRETKEYIY